MIYIYQENIEIFNGIPLDRMKEYSIANEMMAEIMRDFEIGRVKIECVCMTIDANWNKKENATSMVI